jgi:undecaprenyl-diphosphatase
MNAFAAATVIAGAFPLLGIGLLAAAFLVGVSRVVLWLHYPSDVAVGGLLGVALGLLIPPLWASLFPFRLA